MMLALAGVSLAATLAAADVSVGLLGLSGTSEITSDKRDFYVEYLSERLNGGGVTVVTQAQVAALIGLERQRQLLGCSEGEGRCLAELAGALGTDALIVGTVAKIGARYAITIKALDVGSTKVVTAMSESVDAEEQLLGFLDRAATTIRADLLRVLRGVTVAPSATKRSLLGPIVTAAAGGATLVVSALLFGLAKGAERRLLDGDPTITSRQASLDVASGGRGLQLTSGVLLGVGLAAAAGALVWFFLGSKSADAQVAQWWSTGDLNLLAVAR